MTYYAATGATDPWQTLHHGAIKKGTVPTSPRMTKKIGGPKMYVGSQQAPRWMTDKVGKPKDPAWSAKVTAVCAHHGFTKEKHGTRWDDLCEGFMKEHNLPWDLPVDPEEVVVVEPAKEPSVLAGKLPWIIGGAALLFLLKRK